uniref:Uncharacterized protein n=1 Tax=Meloidogyne enterolobii TaxID=390850 RepID=A0A6V7WWT3_MELEN|nr:unnamed protein product [Meloidogyne enterolobii]
MSKSFNFLLLLLSILILLPKASGGGPGGRGGRRAHRGGRSRESGDGPSTSGNLQGSAGTSSSSRSGNIEASSSTGDGPLTTEQRATANVLLELIRDYSLQSVADYCRYESCYKELESLLAQQAQPVISKQCQKILEEALSKEEGSKSKLKAKKNKMISDGSAVTKIMDYCDNYMLAVFNEIKDNCRVSNN